MTLEFRRLGFADGPRGEGPQFITNSTVALNRTVGDAGAGLTEANSSHYSDVILFQDLGIIVIDG